MHEGHRVAVGRLDRHDPSVGADGPGERDDTWRRGQDRVAFVACDVDTSVLSAGVGIVAQDERRDHVAGGGPRPRLGGCGDDEGDDAEQDQGDAAAHGKLLVGWMDNASDTVPGASDVVNSAYSDCS